MNYSYTMRNGDRSERVKLIQRALGLDDDGVFGPKTESTLADFQFKNDLDPDGVAGPKTLFELKLYGLPFYDRSNRIGFSRLDADPYRDGYHSVRLRDDIAIDFISLKREVNGLGGIVTSSGGTRSLSAKVNVSRSATSMHYTGRAFDLFVGSAMRKPSRDPYIITEGDDGYWNVWFRSEKGRLRDLDAIRYIPRGGRYEVDAVSAKVLNFTEIARSHNFEPIRPRRAWPRIYGCAEWWHFQNVKFLKKGRSRFGDELLLSYSLEMLRNSKPWTYRSHLYGVDFF
jgi:hypothetical protein